MQSDTKAILTAARAIWRMKWIVLLVAVIATLGVYYQQSRTPRDYEANADLLFRFGREYYPISPGEQRRNWGENVIVSLDAAIFTEMRLLSSHQLFERTLATVGMNELARSPLPRTEPREKTTGDPQLAAVRQLAGMFEISRVEGAALVEVVARHPVPEVADRLLEAHVENYLAWRSELFDRDASAYFEVQLQSAREEHQGLVSARAELVSEYGIVDAPFERDMLRRELEQADRLAEAGEEASNVPVEQIREKLQDINAFESLVEPLDARIRAVLDNIAALETEEANWTLTQDFGIAVAPSVVEIDFRTANGNPVGFDPKIGAALAGILSAVLASLIIAGYGLMSEALSSARRDDH